MENLKIYHNTHDLFYREPFGALPCNSTVKLKIQTFDIKQINMELKVFKDNEEYFQAKLQKAGEEGPVSVFAAEITAPAEPCLLWYYFVLDTGGQVYYYGNNCEMLGGWGRLYKDRPLAFQITVHLENNETPQWLKEAIMYQIFVDRFYNGLEDGTILNPKKGALIHAHWDNDPVYIRDVQSGRVIRWDFFGGNLLGIIQKLSYLRNLGINVLYLNPIFEAPSNHKYDTANYHKIDSMFGDNSIFKLLCQIAGKMGIKVILDGVFSHTGSDSIYFNKEGNYPEAGAYQSPASPYFSWYRFTNYPHEYESWWGIDSLPNVNELDPSYLSFMIHDENSVGKKWVKMGAAGWRLDVADELPDEFIRLLRQAVKDTDPEAVLIGEVWEDASNKISYGERREYLFGNELDSVTNYPFRNIILDYLLEIITAKQVHDRFMSLYENYPIHHFYSAMNLIGTHDTARALTVLSEMPPQDTLNYAEKSNDAIPQDALVAGIARMKLASLFQMTFPGMPCIYYGDEAGLKGYRDPFCRRTYPWGSENKELLAWYEKIISIRNKYDCLKTGTWHSLVFNQDVYGYLREIKDGRDVFGQTKENNSLLVIFNRRKDREYYVEYKLLDSVQGQIKDLLEPDKSHMIMEGSDRLGIKVNPLGARLILLK